MDLAWLSLAALAAVVVISCFSRANPGVIAIGLAWLVANVPSGETGKAIGTKGLIESFNSDLLLTIIGVALLFAQAEANGTLSRVVTASQRFTRGRRLLTPVMYFLLAALIGSAGPGNIAVAGLLAPLAMLAAAEEGTQPLVMALAVGHGAIASTLSPFTVSGVTAAKIMAGMGITGQEWRVFTSNAVANALAALVGCISIGAWRWWRNGRRPELDIAPRNPTEQAASGVAAFSPQHWLTLGVILALVVAVVAGRIHIGLGAFCGAGLLSLFRAADERAALAKVPWGVILMVSGVSLLASLLDRTGGTARFAQIISTASTPRSSAGLVALVTGVVSIYSSTTGVVLPAFLPMVKELVAAQPGSDPLKLSLAVVIGGNLVDMSPLSTIGALCLAAAPAGADHRRLFQQLLAWGFLLAAAAGIVCWLW